MSPPRQTSQAALKKGRGTPPTSDPATPGPEPRIGVTPLLVLISAPSGGGKTTVCNQLLAARPEMSRAITCTTRSPRPGEVAGVDYYFLDPESFRSQVDAGRFLEHAKVYGHSYGTTKDEVLQKLRLGRDVLLAVDVQGAATIRKRALEDPELRHVLVTVFLTPASVSILEQRLRRRGTDSDDVIARRLGEARQEIGRWKDFDYLVISTTVQEDLRRMLTIVDAEKLRSSRVTPPET